MQSRITYTTKRSTSFCLAGVLSILLSSSLSVAQTPVAHWTFDDGLNDYGLTTISDVVNGNDAVWQNGNAEDGFNTAALGYTAGMIGGAVKLGGGNNNSFLIDAVPQIDGIVPTPPLGGGDPVLGVGVTWSAWMYVDESNTSGNQGIFVTRTATDEAAGGQGTNQNWSMNWEGGDHIDARVSGQALDSPADSISRNQWHQVAMVWGNVDGSASFIPPAQRLYVDGVLASEDTDSEVYEMVSSGSWLIGDDSCCNGREFQGLLDDFAIFDSALSTAQVQTLYNNGLNGINASGISTDAVVAGDVDGGGVTIDDFNIIRDNLGKTVNARSFGDLDGNRLVDLDDFQQWLDAAPPAMASQALSIMAASVPEPSSLILAAVAAVACLRRRPTQISSFRVRR